MGNPPTKGSWMTYQPKGGQCASCMRNKDDCSHLPFDEMRVLETHGGMEWDCVKIVSCSSYSRSELKSQASTEKETI